MPENNKIAEFLQKLAPCIARGDLDACLEEAARVAREMGMESVELSELSIAAGMNGRYDFAYVIALAAVHGLEGEAKAEAYYYAGAAAQYLRKIEKAEEQYKLAIVAKPNLAEAHYNYAILLSELNRKTEAEEQYKLAIAANPNLAEPHSNYANMLKELNRKTEAEEQYKLTIAINPNHVGAHSNYAILLSELNRKTEAEEQYKLAIAANPNLADAQSNYAILLSELNRKTEAEEWYKLAIAANPNLAEAHYNYANMLKELNRKTEAEEQYKLAIVANPNYAAAHYNYAILLSELSRKSEAEEQYKLAIVANPNLAEAHYNYALLLSELNRKTEVEEQYKLAIAANLNYAVVHYNYANLLSELNRKTEAEDQYKLAIAANPNLAEAHGAYGLFLIENDHRENSWEETKIASDLFQKTLRFMETHLVKAWFYEGYSKKYVGQNKFPESSDDAYAAGQEYLKAADTTVEECEEKSAFMLRGNELIAKSYIRKEHKNPQELINNLKVASEYYKKASVCQVGGREEVCAACQKVINVFSEVLNSLDDIIKDKVPLINKNQWKDDLEKSQIVYDQKKSEKGIKLIETLKAFIKCVDELYDYKKRKSIVQEKRLKDCYKKLIEVSANIEGGLKNITDPAADIIKEYARKKGYLISDEFLAMESPSRSKSKLFKVILGILGAIIIGYITNLLSEWKVHQSIMNLIKSLIFGSNVP